MPCSEDSIKGPEQEEDSLSQPEKAGSSVLREVLVEKLVCRMVVAPRPACLRQLVKLCADMRLIEPTAYTGRNWCVSTSSIAPRSKYRRAVHTNLIASVSNVAA